MPCEKRYEVRQESGANRVNLIVTFWEWASEILSVIQSLTGRSGYISLDFTLFGYDVAGRND